MTAGLLCSVRRKQELSLKVCKHPNNTKLASYFKKYKNKFTTILRAAKTNYFKYKFNKLSSSPKHTWKVINEITDRKNTRNDDIKKIKINDRTINTCDNPKLVSNTFNNFFTNLGKNLSNNIEKSNMTYKEDVFAVSFNQFFTEIICESEVLKVINNLKDETSAGIDEISVKIIKHVANKIISPLTHIYNLSIKNSIFPEKFKVAVIKPLFKNGDKTCINNYRPISMLSNFSKIF